MKARRASKGEASILILLLLIGTIATFALLSGRLARVRYAPIVRESFWDVNGQRVTIAMVGAEVKAHVMIEVTEEYVGSLVVRIRKDIALWPDSDYQVLTLPINLVGGEEEEEELAFVPDESSDNGLRGYFIEIDFGGTETKWVMEASYPPRLKVVQETFQPSKPL